MENIIEALHQTMQKSLLDDLKKYIEIHKEEKIFCIYSDYCLEDKNKSNKVASFTIAPAWTALPDSQKIISNAIPADIKNSQNLSSKGASLLNNKAFFHISFMIKDTSGIAYRKNKNSQDILISGINESIRTISDWKQNQPEGIDKFTEQINRFQRWQKKLERKSPNIALAKNIILIPTLAAYISFLLTKYANATKIIWFSDRDKIINSCDEIAYDIFDISHFSLCKKFNAKEPYSEIGLSVSEVNTKNLWFDSLIRIPDYLAGTLSSWNTSLNLVDGKKHAQVLQKVFAGNDFCCLININFGKNVFSCSRQDISIKQ